MREKKNHTKKSVMFSSPKLTHISTMALL